MEYEDKVKEINELLKQNIYEGMNVVVWGAGIHTEQLLLHTYLGQYLQQITIVDKRLSGEELVGKNIESVDRINWKLINVVIISSLTYQDEIENQLKKLLGYSGMVLRLYSAEDKVPFYMLPKDKDFLYLSGNYMRWSDTHEVCNRGYAEDDIFEDRVRRKEWLAESPSISNRYCYDLYSALLRCFIENNYQKIGVLDFGGGFGIMYFAFKAWVDTFNIIDSWTVVEQQNVVDYGKHHLEDGVLKFANEISEIKNFCKDKVEFVLFGSSLQYVENYECIQQECLEFAPDYVMILKTPVANTERICIQSVNLSKLYDYYSVRYPLHIFTKNSLLDIFLQRNYDVLDEHKDTDTPDNYIEGDKVIWMSYLIKKNKDCD